MAVPIWSDPRNLIPPAYQADQEAVHDQDVYLTRVRIPDGRDQNTEH